MASRIHLVPDSLLLLSLLLACRGGRGEQLSPPDASCQGIFLNPSREKKQSQVTTTETPSKPFPLQVVMLVLGSTDTQEGLGGGLEEL